MKLSILTLDRRTISLEMSDSQNVRTLKQRLSDMPEVAMPADSLQLIYAGRIMEDELPLREYQIAADKNIVLMGKKSVQAAQPREQEHERKQEKVQAPVPSTPPPPPPATNGPSETPVGMPSLAPNEQRVRDLMDMGYGEQEVREALRASFNHPERAIEYLINGIPPQAGTDTSAAAAQPTEGGLQELANSPALARVREMIRQDPRLLDQILTRLAETEPEAFEMIRSHQAEFMALLQGSDNDAAEETVQVNLTADEAAAVGRLEALGFHRALAVQAYLACDKNEEMAAMILFNQAEEEEDQDQDQQLP